MKHIWRVLLSDRRSQRQLWDSASPGSRVLLLAAIFFLFAAIGLTTDVTELGRTRPWAVALTTLFAGAMAATFVVIIVRHLAWLPLLVLLQIAGSVALGRLPQGPAIVPPGPVEEALKQRFLLNVLGTVACISLSYTFFGIFVTRSGREFIRLDTELRLARDIHRALSPRIETVIDGFEFLGTSSPSGDVGGDLVDVVRHDGKPAWTAYLVDVSGHGVPSGVLMGMVKSAVRTALTRPGPLDELLADLNGVLVEVSQPQMFATFAALRPAGHDCLSFTLAGHLPILCWRSASGAIEELTVSQLPLGLLPDRAYAAAETECAPGDLFLVLTDGLTEVFDRSDAEFGLEGVRRVLTANARAPLPAIEKALMAASRAHGAQLDDQSLILIRRR